MKLARIKTQKELTKEGWRLDPANDLVNKKYPYENITPTMTKYLARVVNVVQVDNITYTIKTRRLENEWLWHESCFDFNVSKLAKLLYK